MKSIRHFFLFLMCCLSFQLTAQQVPDFTLVDLNGNEHKIYEDYLDQGKPVFISFFGVWNIWDLTWVDQGVMDEFYNLYGPPGTNSAQVILLEVFDDTDDDALYGNGGGSVGDFVTGHDFPIVNHPNSQEIFDLFDMTFFPYVAVICPDGLVYSSADFQNYVFNDPLMFYGELGTPELMAERSFQNCGVNLLTQFLGGTTYIDANDNCIDDAEQFVPNMMVTIDNGTNTHTRTSNHEGDYLFPTGDYIYDVSATPPSSSWLVCNGTETADFTTGTDEIYIDFGLKAVNECPYPTIDITAPFLRRCFSNVIKVPYCNVGSEVLENTTITVTLDDFFIYQNSSIPPTTISGQVLTYELGDLGVFECGEIVIEFEIDCDAELGELHCYDALIDGSNLCTTGGEDLSNYVEECQENVGAFDPNDKRSFPAGIGDNHEVVPGTSLKYQIRFQNTGTDTAFNIVVLDTLTNLLDITTLRTGASSHPFTFEIIEERTLKFTFEDIMLPDSNINLEASNGFVNFFIEHTEGLSEGTVISNQAAIYFDFNEPVITEETWITLMNPSGVNDPASAIQFSVNPNPTNDNVVVRLDSEDYQSGNWSIFHSSGQELMKGVFEDSSFIIDLDELPKGAYLLRVVDSEGYMGVRKVVKQ